MLIVRIMFWPFHRLQIIKVQTLRRMTVLLQAHKTWMQLYLLSGRILASDTGHTAILDPVNSLPHISAQLNRHSKVASQSCTAIHSMQTVALQHQVHLLHPYRQGQQLMKEVQNLQTRQLQH